MDEIELQKEVDGWAYFHFAMLLWGKLPEPFLFEDIWETPPPDKEIAQMMLKKAVQGGVIDFRSALFGTKAFLERRYRGAPDDVIPGALGAIERLIKTGQ